MIMQYNDIQRTKEVKTVTIKTIKTRIYLNNAQKQQVMSNFGACRFVWNQLLNLQQERYKNGDSYINRFGMNYLITEIKREYPFLKTADSTSLLEVSNNLHQAYQRFFKKQNGFPKFKSRKYPKQSYQSNIVGQNIRQLDEHRLQLPKLGKVRFSAGRDLTGKIKSATIKMSATGNFYAMIVVDTEVQALPKTGNAVGIDMGVADLMITSDGVKYPTIRFDKMLSKKKRHWERKLARRRALAEKEIAWDKHNKVDYPRTLMDFNNYQKARVMVAKYNEKSANQRHNYNHLLTTYLVKQYDVIKIEDLKTKNLLKNHKLARAIANQGWGELRSQLEYKCAWYGKQLVIVNPRKTSQICSNCGFDDGKHELNIRQWTCPDCGTNHDRDINAAINILNA